MVAGSTTSAMAAVSVMKLLVHADEQILAREAARTLACSGATFTGLVFWMIIAVTGGPPSSASRSPQRIAPIRDWSSSRVAGSAMSSPSIIVLSRR